VGEPSNVEQLPSGSRSSLKPRRSLEAAIPTDVMSQPQAEDLSVSGRQQRNVRPASCCTNEEASQLVQYPYWNVEKCSRNKSSSHLSKTQQHPRLWAVEDSERQSLDLAEPSQGGNLQVVRDIDSWLETSIIGPVEHRAVTETSPNAVNRGTSLDWNVHAQQTMTNSQTHEHQASYTGQRSMYAASAPSLEVCTLSSGTLLAPHGSKVTSAASCGVSVFSPPVAYPSSRPLPQNENSKTRSCPVYHSLDSLGGRSSRMFARTPVLPTAVQHHGLAGCSLWATPGRGLCEPSPVATVMPQVQMAIGSDLEHPHPTPHQSSLTKNAENTMASAAPPPARKRKRKRRSVFGARRRTKKSQQSATMPLTPDEAAAATHNPLSNNPIAKPAEVVTKPNPVLKVPNTTTAATTKPSVGCSNVPMINAKSISITPVIQSAPSTSVRSQQLDGMRRALKPIGNQQRVHFLTSSDVCRPSTAQRNVPVGLWLDAETAGGNHKAPRSTYTNHCEWSLTDVQKVPSTSSQPRDIFEFCEDDDDMTEPRDQRPVPRPFRPIPSSFQLASKFTWPAATAVTTAHQTSRATFTSHGTLNKLR